MALADIPIKHQPVKVYEINGLGLSAGAQIAIGIGASLATAAITMGGQLYMHRQQKKEQEKQLKEQEARRRQLEREAQEQERRVMAEQRMLQERMIQAQQQAAIIQAQNKRKTQQTLIIASAIGGTVLLGVMALAFLMKRRPAA